MELFIPVNGLLRRTHHEGIYAKFTLSSKEYTVQIKLGYIQVSCSILCKAFASVVMFESTLWAIFNSQVDNQLSFSVYPQVLYPVPPPPTVASNIGTNCFVCTRAIIFSLNV